jgi:hypothetical protein
VCEFPPALAGAFLLKGRYVPLFFGSARVFFEFFCAAFLGVCVFRVSQLQLKASPKQFKSTILVTFCYLYDGFWGRGESADVSLMRK